MRSLEAGWTDPACLPPHPETATPTPLPSFHVGPRWVDLGRRLVDDVPLTEQEAQLLAVLAEAGGQVVGKAELYRRVWGYRGVPRGRALDFAVRRLRSKLEDDAAAPTLLVTVRGTGFRLAVDDAPTPQRPPPSTGPREPASPLIGRDVLIDTLRDAITRLRDAETPAFLTLLGPGGSGKTRLSQRLVALEAEGDWPGGTAWISLDGVSPDELASTLAATLAPPGTTAPTERLRAALAGPQQLVVLDEAETLAPELGVLLDAILPGGRAVVLVTSRHRLHGAAEQVVDLPPLPADPALELLVSRARAVRASFAVEPSNRASLRALVTKLDGLPLAIELAAPRLRLLSPTDLLLRLDRGPEVLSDGGQLSLASTIAVSWSMLAPQEQVALTACTLFRAPFSLEGAELVLAPIGEPLDLLDALVDQSFLQLRPDDSGEPVFSLLTTVATWVRAQETSLPDGCERGLIAYFSDPLGSNPRLALVGPDGAWLRGRFIGESATAWVAARRAPTVRPGSAGLLWMGLTSSLRSGGRVDEALHAAETGAALIGPDDIQRPHILLMQARMSWELARRDEARDLLERASAIAAGKAAEGWAHRGWAMFHVAVGDRSSAAEAIERAFDAAQVHGDALLRANLLSLRTQIFLDSSRFEDARAAGEEAVGLYREVGSLHGEQIVNTRLAPLALQRGDVAEATALLERSVFIAREHNERAALAGALTNLGLLQGMLDQPQSAPTLREALTHLAPRQLHMRAQVQASIASIALWNDQLDEALRWAHQSLGLLDGTSYERVRLSALGVVVQVQARRRDDDQSRARDLLERSRRAGSKLMESVALATLARAQAVGGELTEAMGSAEGAWELAQEFGDTTDHVLVACARAEVAAAAGDAETSAASLRVARGIADRLSMFPAARRDVERAEARIAAVTAD